MESSRITINPVFELLRSDGSITINKALCFAVGINETIIYSELLSRFNYFKNENKLTEDGYFYNTVDDLCLGTGLGEKVQRNAINNLVKLGLIETALKGVPARRHFKINESTDTILALIEEGKKQIDELEKKQKERMKQKIKRNKFHNSSYAKKKELICVQVEELGEFSSDENKEFSTINSSCENTELDTQNPVPAESNPQFLQKEVYSSEKNEEEEPSESRINNTNIIIQNNNTENNREDMEATSISISDNNTYQEILWSNFMGVIRQQLSEVSFNTWIKSLAMDEIKDNVVVLKAPNDFTKEIYESRYKEVSLKAVKVNNPEINDIEIVVG
ncbi:DnaA N-terminal domain-containing protein [Clostridium peptidivorans]|uniref:DnaA N-terminal domain-containing protein n=1 Tax=Clostridium peptidivorans TaxID=100174 RepID=UPI000BE37A2E|nr:DnaA N-terminal domain-containing protein [Clostridium peptidivorans]